MTPNHPLRLATYPQTRVPLTTCQPAVKSPCHFVTTSANHVARSTRIQNLTEQTQLLPFVQPNHPQTRVPVRQLTAKSPCHLVTTTTTRLPNLHNPHNPPKSKKSRSNPIPHIGATP